MDFVGGFCVATWTRRSIADMFDEIDGLKKIHAKYIAIGDECHILANQYMDKMDKHWWNLVNPFLWRKLRKVMAKGDVNIENIRKLITRWDEIIEEINTRLEEYQME